MQLCEVRGVFSFHLVSASISLVLHGYVQQVTWPTSSRDPLVSASHLPSRNTGIIEGSTTLPGFYVGSEDWNSIWCGKEGFPHSGNSPNATDWFFLRTDGVVLCGVTFKQSPVMPHDVMEEEDSAISYTSSACPHVVAMMTLG